MPVAAWRGGEDRRRQAKRAEFGKRARQLGKGEKR